MRRFLRTQESSRLTYLSDIRIHPTIRDDFAQFRRNPSKSVSPRCAQASDFAPYSKGCQTRSGILPWCDVSSLRILWPLILCVSTAEHLAWRSFRCHVIGRRTPYCRRAFVGYLFSCNTARLGGLLVPSVQLSHPRAGPPGWRSLQDGC